MPFFGVPIRNGLPIGLGSAAGFGIQPFDPSYLFANGEPGAWYDPSDYSTLFQNAAGTTPVTAVEQPVGLMLDKRQGLVLGPELVTNGDFSGGLTSWSTNNTDANNTVTASGGVCTIVTNGSGTGSVGPTQAITTVAGRFYKITFTIVSATSSGAGVWAGPTQATSTLLNVAFSTGAGTYSAYFAATGTTTWIAINRFSAATVVIDNVSVKEIAGNHAFQTTSASRPTLSARVNLLTKTEQFDDAVWVKDVSGTAVVTVSANSTTAPDGTTTADTLTEIANTNTHRSSQSYTNLAGVTYTFSVYVKNASGNRFVGLSPVNSQTVGNNCAAVFNLATQQYLGVQTAGGTLVGTVSNPTITPLPNGWFRLSVSVSAATGGSAGASIFLFDSFVNNGTSQGTYAGNGTSGIYIWGADLRVANDGVGIPAYQRVNTSTDYDTSGFPIFLNYDGSDDSMLTNSVNFTATDKMTVFAGVRKLSDAAAGVLSELSADRNANNGAWTLSCPASVAGSNFSFSSKGTVSDSATSVSGYAAPLSSVLSGIGNISGDSTILRINGTQAASSTGDQGTGNYGNYPLYIGRRGGTTLPLNGRIYSLIIRGAASTAAQIASTEAWVNGKTKAY